LNQDLLVISLIAGIIFGAKKLPEIGKGLGEGIKGFKNAMTGQDDDEVSAKPK